MMRSSFFFTCCMIATVVSSFGCRTPPVSRVATPTVRLYLMSNVEGALEPCGCVPDQLGGVDRLVSLIEGQKEEAPFRLLGAVGPLFFAEPQIPERERSQALFKAETFAAVFRRLGLTAFAPGYNDWAAGETKLEALTEASGGAMLFANRVGAQPRGRIQEINGQKIGFVGVSNPSATPGVPPLEGVQVDAAVQTVKGAFAEFQRQHVPFVVVLAAVGRGEAKRIADAVPGLTAVVVGKPGGAELGVAEDPLPVERIGEVLVLETPSQLQSVGMLDLFVRDSTSRFVDAMEPEQKKRQQALARDMRGIRKRLAEEVKAKRSSPERTELEQRLTKLEAESKALERVVLPDTGNFFHYQMRELRAGLGSDPKSAAELLTYYRTVNEHNRKTFANRKPLPPEPGQPTYVGVERCAACHTAPMEVWKKTPHAHAYATLSSQSKEFNLDCVGCHVTGYEKPGGSTVIGPVSLQNVQCESCHGPGSVHIKTQSKEDIVRRPSPDTCTACHHPPHVHSFDPGTEFPRVLGPGHGLPLSSSRSR